jgi:hypothetical protein
MPIAEDKKKEIQNVFRTFLQNQARLIQRLRIEDLHINPFLIRILSKEMGLEDASSIVRWLVSQRLERSMVTSFGLALQEAARVFSEGTGVEGADILKTKDGRHHYIQVKSGPIPSRRTWESGSRNSCVLPRGVTAAPLLYSGCAMGTRNRSVASFRNT